MRRHLLNVAAALSFLLCVGCGAIWVRSYFRYDAIYFNRVSGTAERPERRFFHARSSLGSVSLCSQYENAVSSMINPYDRAKLGRGWETLTEHTNAPQALPFPGGGGWLGFRGHFESQDHPKQIRRERLVIVPYWFPTALFALPPAVWAVARARRGRPAGHCPTCGYDLRATPGRCPECGMEPQPVTR